MRPIPITIIAVFITATAARAEPQTRRYDARGNSIGTAVPQGQGSTRYYDAQGRSLGPVDSEFVDMMKARSVWYISTIVLDYTNFVFADQPPWMREPFLQRALHPAVRAQFDDPEYRERTLASPATAKNRAAVTTNKQNLKAAHDAGIGVGFGSDSGVGLRIPGVAEHLELALMVEAWPHAHAGDHQRHVECSGAAEA
jgi:YD repeat-containing protein